MTLTTVRDRNAIEYHYDVSDDFYKLFLDSRMVYSCAYFRSPENSLEQAQQDKLELICRKLNLQAGERLLDVGCGWGALTVWAARQHGVSVHAITLSPHQAAWAERWIAREGLQGRCTVELAHWKDFAPRVPFDKVAAVGIIEHVGKVRYVEFFEKIMQCLNPGGLFLNHGITHRHEWKPNGHTRFINKYVFPNGELDSITNILTTAKEWEVLDVEQLREHYARTCRLWVDGLQRNREEGVRLAGEKTYRIWLSYLAGSAVAFESGDLGLYQTVLRRPPFFRPINEITTREQIYRNWKPVESE